MITIMKPSFNLPNTAYFYGSKEKKIEFRNKWFSWIYNNRILSNLYLLKSYK